MLSRERVANTLLHNKPDRVPISLGGTAHKLSDSRYQVLKQHFGIQGDSPQRLTGAYLSYSDNRVLDALGTDIRYVHLRPATGYMQNKLPDGTWVDEWGLTHRVLENGFYELGGTPLANATVADLDRYPWPDPHDPARLAGLREETLDLYLRTPYALAAYRPTLSGIFELAHSLRGMERLLMDLVLDKTFVDALFTKLALVLGEFYKAYLDVVGPYVEIVELADDVGTQVGPMFAPKLYRQLLREKHAYLAKIVKEKAPQAKFLLHSCGSVKAFIPDFIEAGFGILNPVQPLAKDMQPAKLKAEFGGAISFLGGVDVQQTMRGPVAGVRAEVRQRIEELGPGGGYIVAPSHNFSDDIPLENILAFFETAHESGLYGN
jgi:uroporphyrinogen decarboxylase